MNLHKYLLLYLSLVVPFGVEPNFPGWKPSVLTIVDDGTIDKRISKFSIFHFASRARRFDWQIKYKNYFWFCQPIFQNFSKINWKILRVAAQTRMRFCIDPLVRVLFVSQINCASLSSARGLFNEQGFSLGFGNLKIFSEILHFLQNSQKSVLYWQFINC